MSSKRNCEHLGKYFKNVLKCDPSYNKLNGICSILLSKNFRSLVCQLRKRLEMWSNALKTMKLYEKTPSQQNFLNMLERMVVQLRKLLQQIWKRKQSIIIGETRWFIPYTKRETKLMPTFIEVSYCFYVYNTYKILFKVLKQRIEGYLDKQVDEYQAGFRKRRPTVKRSFPWSP